MLFGLDFDNFELQMVDVNEFSGNFVRTAFNLYDPSGELTGKKYSYGVWFSMTQAKVEGSSNLYLMVFDAQSWNKGIEGTHSEDVIKRTLEANGIDINEIKEGKKILVAKYNGKAFLNKFTMSIAFDPIRRKMETT
ncbi:MAG TPA: hypothetical protein ENF81_01520 [Thermotogaceae bacterium]|nr:hypothetical protein [Thermotogaceae bacterium]